VRLPAWGAIFRRAARDARTRTIAFGYVFAIVAYVNPATYKSTYPTLASRIAFSRSFADNKAVVLFYGKAYNLLTVGGYAAWRSGGTLAIFAAVFGLFAAVRALRTEEETGRAELVLSGAVGRMSVFGASLAAIAASTIVLLAAELAGLLLAGLPLGGSALLALATATVVPVFAGAGALVSQVAPTRRMALQLGVGGVMVAFLLRVIADTSNIGWVRWTTPLGWAEMVRPFTGPEPLVLLVPLAVSAVLLAIAARIQAGRDIGAGVLKARDSADPRLYLLSSTTSQALREERTGLAVWTLSVGASALIVGIVSKSINSSVISAGLQRQLAKFGEGSIVTPVGYIAFAFIFFVLALSLFACAQVAAARHEEAEERLETLLPLPVSRTSWLGGRLGLAAGGAVVICLVAGLMTWAGARLEGVTLSLPNLLEAGANCLPVTVLFLGLATLAYALFPRASIGIAYGLVALAFLWYLFGSLVGVPHWLIRATPFAHVAAVPVQSFRVGAAAIMVGVGLAAAMIALAFFRRRDLVGP
jgi:ABC-2 type transport system permease protein